MDISQTADETPDVDGSETPQQAEVCGPEPSSEEIAVNDDDEHLLLQVLQELQVLRQEFSAKLKYDATKERQVDSLYQELQGYREGLHFKILKPLFIDLIAMHDDLGKIAERLAQNTSDAACSSMHSNLKSFQETVEEILKRNGVESFSIDSDTYVPGKQRIVRVIETLNIAEDKKIARRVRQGFRYDERILRQELIHTYRFVDATP
jgi:molecular chaperone GrpE